MTNMAGPAVRVAGLQKAFRRQVVLDGLDLEIATGSVYALLGPNGAGKTTTIRILSTLLAPDAGRVEVGGHDVVRDPEGVRAVIGVTGQFSAVDGKLTGAENLLLMADLRHLSRPEGRRRVAELLERFELSDAAAKVVSTYSGGMQRRLDLAMTLVGDPRIIFLDEPTAGLDPRSRRTMWQIVRELVAAGVTILLTTQNLDEADELAGRIGVLDRGKLVAQGTPDELKRLVPGGHLRLHFADATALVAASRLLGVSTPDDESLALEVPSDGTVAGLRATLGRLDDRSIGVEALTLHAPDLDDVFLALTSATRTETDGAR